VPRFLSDEWMAEVGRLAADRPERAGVSALVHTVVTGGPDGDVTWACRIEDGRVVESAPADGETPDFTLTLPYELAVEIQQGDLDPNVAFMRGRMKFAGESGIFLSVMSLTATPEYADLQERVRAVTEY
jgi:hypothetical protein